MRTVLPTSTAVVDVLKKISESSKIIINIPSELDGKNVNKGDPDGDLLKTKLLVSTCLTVALNETGYEFTVRDGQVFVVNKAELQATDRALVYDLGSLDQKTVDLWEQMVVQIIQPNIWKQNGGDSRIDARPKQKKAIAQCSAQVHKQIDYFTFVLRHYSVGLRPPLFEVRRGKKVQGNKKYQRQR